MNFLPKPKPRASGTAGCEKIVGIKSEAVKLSIHFDLTCDTGAFPRKLTGQLCLQQFVIIRPRRRVMLGRTEYLDLFSSSLLLYAVAAGEEIVGDSDGNKNRRPDHAEGGQLAYLTVLP